MPKDEGVRRIDLPIRRSTRSLSSSLQQLLPGGDGGGQGQTQKFACFAVPGVLSAVAPPARSAPSFVAYRYDLAIKRVIAHVITAPVGSDITASVYKNGVLIATITIAAGTNDSNVVASGGLVSGDYLDMSITAVGSTTPGSHLTVQVECWGDVF